MSEFVFNFSSVVVEELEAPGQVLVAIGMRKVWSGTHPFFKCRAVAYATQKGGTVLLERGSESHAAVQAFAGAKERNFHICLLARDFDAQRKRCAASRYVDSVSDDYQGVGGRSFAVELRILDQHGLWLEFTEGHGNLLSAPDSDFLYVDSVAMCAARRSDLLEPLASIGLASDKVASDGYFSVLGTINAVILLGWHYLEVAEPTDQTGVMMNFLQRIGHPGIFGINLACEDMERFVAATRAGKVDTNTEKPVLLMVDVRGKEYRCADIITINPRATGGARIFVLKPFEYPWKLVA